MEPSSKLSTELKQDITESVERALREDIGSGDITAQLIPADVTATAKLITREAATICGQPWVEEVYKQLDPSVEIQWQCNEGDQVEADQLLCTLSGNARALLTGERAALNYLQTLSGTATTATEFARLIGSSSIKILDTRKTIPGLRLAQKYAVKIGGCHNHRIGLYDAFLIKENHIAACGGIANAVSQAKVIAPGKPVEVEVESLDELQQAITAGADIVMLDNFTAQMVEQAVSMAAGQVKLEVSGNITKADLEQAATAGIDFISSGALTKHCRAIDLSFRLVEQN